MNNSRKTGLNTPTALRKSRRNTVSTTIKFSTLEQGTEAYIQDPVLEVSSVKDRPSRSESGILPFPIREELNVYDSFKGVALTWVRSGYLPGTDTEIEQTSAYVKGLDSLSSLCERELERNFTYTRDIREMSSLRALQKDLVPHRKFVRYLISPIRKLPPEILYQIFELKYAGTYRGSLDHHKFHLEIKGTSVDCPTLKLTWVCSYWRNLIIARPTLWNSMRLEVDYIERSSKMIDIFHYHILHSASVPLTLYLSGQYVSRLTPVHPVIDELLNNIGRWYRVHLALSGLPEDFSSFRDIPGGSIASVVPILEYMNIGTSALPMRLLSSCPNLRVFKASSISWRTFSRCDFRHLRTFQVGSINPSNIIMANFLRRMPQLKEFYMTNNYTNRSGLTAIPAQSLDPNPYCSTITILSVSLGCLWSGTWKNLLFPCLESFRCQTSHRVTSEHIASFSELASILARSDSRLEDVIFTNIPAKTAKDFLNYHPSISKFEYSGEFGATMYDEIFVLLTVLQRTDMSVVAIAPNLRTLFIDSTQYRLPVDHLLEDICSMALSRSVEPSHFGEEVHGIRVVQLKAMILGRNMENLINELQRRLASIRVSEV